jgi:hypothetical protein
MQTDTRVLIVNFGKLKMSMTGIQLMMAACSRKTAHGRARRERSLNHPGKPHVAGASQDNGTTPRIGHAGDRRPPGRGTELLGTGIQGHRN